MNIILGIVIGIMICGYLTIGFFVYIAVLYCPVYTILTWPISLPYYLICNYLRHKKYEKEWKEDEWND